MELDYEKKKKIGHYIEISKNMNKADPQEEIVVNKKTNKALEWSLSIEEITGRNKGRTLRTLS